MIGRTISHYTVLEKLGAGGMGEIFKAQDTRLNRFVAMKVLSTANSGDVERRRRFVQEAQAASALNHPNIITIHDVVSADGLEFMVMEFVSGVTLDDLVPKHGLNVQKTLDCAVQMADALQAAHAAGIVHRDLKPGNVMVTGSGLVKILDFGIAKLTGPTPSTQGTDETLPIDSPMTVEGSILGTVCYMSPEQAQAKSVDPRSDIFSFGLVLYEMLTGHKAFSGDSALSTLSAILRDEAKPMSELVQGVPPELEAIVFRAMRKEPDQRWQSMAEMRAALLPLKQKSDSGVLLTGTMPAPPPVAKKKNKMSGAVAGLIAAGILVFIGVAGVGGWWWMKHRQQPAPAPTVAEVIPPPVTPPVETPPTDPAAGTIPPAPPAEAGLTNQNILDMVAAKVPASVIISQIRSSKTSFDLSTEQIINLSKAGVTPALIEIMRNPKGPDPASLRSAKGTSPATTLTKGATPQTAVQPPVQAAPTPVTPPVNQTQAPAPVQAAPAVSAAPQTPTRLHTVSILGGLPFLIALNEDVPIKVTAGQLLHFRVVKELKVGDVVVIAKGTPVNGQVADAGDGKKLLIMKNKATFTLNSVESVAGTKLAIRATPGKKADDKVEHQIEAPGKKTKDILAPAGTEYTAYLDGDQTITLKH